MLCLRRSWVLASFSESKQGASSVADNLCKRQTLEDELLDMEYMYHQGAGISRERIYHCLQECTRRKDLSASRRVHDLMDKSGLSSVAVLGNHLIRIFGAYGSLQEANEVFLKISVPTVHTWNGIISAYIQHGDPENALALYDDMRVKHQQLDIVTSLLTLKACGDIGNITRGQVIHDHIVRNAFEPNVSICNALINMYSKCGGLMEAQRVFERLPKPTLFSWGTIIGGFSKHGQEDHAIKLFEKMKHGGMPPDKVIFLAVFRACAGKGAIEKGSQIHSQMIMFGFDEDTTVGTSVVDMYCKFGCLFEARKVFDTFPKHPLSLWGALINGYIQHGDAAVAFELYTRMVEMSIKPDKIIFLSVLKAFSSIPAIEKGRNVHKQISLSEYKTDIDILNAIIEMYAKCGDLNEALEIFDKLLNPNAMSWDALIAGFLVNQDNMSCLNAFERMVQKNLKPSESTISSVLQACSDVGAIHEGRMIHHMVCKEGFTSNVVIGNTLIDMYAKSGSLDEASRVFHNLPDHNMVSWTVLMSGFVQHGEGHSALNLFQRMKAENVISTKTTLSCALKACGSIGALKEGQQIHDEVVNVGYETDLIVGSSLVDMYVKCKILEEAQRVFDKLHVRDAVAWAAMLAGYATNGYGARALETFEKMLADGFRPDKVTFFCVLKACGSVGGIKQGELIFNEIIRDGHEADVTIGNTVLDMYVKCGRLESAHNIFIHFPIRTVVAWGAMIAGNAEHGNFEVVKSYLNDMQHEGVKPDDVIFTNILAACSHAGKLAEGRFYFNLMKEQYCISPNAEQYSCMIDLLGRAGCFKEAEDYIESYPGSPDFITWVSLLSSCRSYGNVELGRRCYKEICKLDSDDASGYVLMSGICVEAQLWEEVDKVLESRKKARAWKKPGMAWIEVNNHVHEFIVRDDNQPENPKICNKLQSLFKGLKQHGYQPTLDSVMEPKLGVK